MKLRAGWDDARQSVEVARALEAVRVDTASDRVNAEGARAAAQVDAEAIAAALETLLPKQPAPPERS